MRAMAADLDLRVMIRTGAILADLAQSLGYRLVGTDLFRTRPSTVTGEQLREEVVFLEWPRAKRREHQQPTLPPAFGCGTKTTTPSRTATARW